MKYFLLLSAMIFGAGPGRAQDRGPTASFAVEPAGFATYPIPTQALEAGVFLSATDAVSLSYARGSTTQLLAKYDAQLALLRYKLFFGSFSHFNFGVGYRSLTSNFDVKTTSATTSVTMSSSAVVGEASFGNQILLGPLFVGCDWIGGTVPAFKLKEKNNYPDDADEEETENYEQSFGKVAYKPIMQFMRVYVGAEF